jgi:DNA-binding transcriptional regulator YhcF (GntR family)
VEIIFPELVINEPLWVIVMGIGRKSASERKILLAVVGLVRCCSPEDAKLANRPSSEVALAQNRDQFAYVVARLRERLRGGDYMLGEPLTVNDLARDFGASATPVREALARLAGEGLVEDRRGRGYFAWRMDVSDLTDLYHAQESLTLTGLSVLIRCTAEPAAPSFGRALPPSTTATLLPVGEGRVGGPQFWETLTWRVTYEAGQRYLLGAQQRLADRLAPARRVEPMILPEEADTLNGLADHVNRRAWRSLSTDIRPFFIRRCAAAGAIVDRLRVESRF